MHFMLWKYLGELPLEELLKLYGQPQLTTSDIMDSDEEDDNDDTQSAQSEIGTKSSFDYAK